MSPEAIMHGIVMKSVRDTPRCSCARYSQVFLTEATKQHLGQKDEARSHPKREICRTHSLVSPSSPSGNNLSLNASSANVVQAEKVVVTPASFPGHMAWE